MYLGGLALTYSETLLASKQFSIEDQRGFSLLTGDVNPIHVDSVASRRTVAGRPVVHGIHLLLWALDSYCKQRKMSARPVKLTARFSKFVRIDELASAILTEESSDGCRIDVRCNGALAALIQFSNEPLSLSGAPITGGKVWNPKTPISPSPAEIGEMKGSLKFASLPDKYGAHFPNVARDFGARRLAALGCSTFLVGMVVPGAHSIFSKLAVEIGDEDGTEGISFAVRKFDRRLSFLTTEIAGSGIEGWVESILRPRPTDQPAIESILEQVEPTEFAGRSVLIVGGSRGLGELTAKIVAAGGGNPIISYASSHEDAMRVKNEINGANYRCEIIHIDIERDIEKQLDNITTSISSIYYFATPQIFGHSTFNGFNPQQFSIFNKYYVDGFLRLVRYFFNKEEACVRIFYPSSSAVTELSSGMMEYVMAKSAGEIACKFLERETKCAGIVIERLPRLRTDQTNSLLQTDYLDSTKILLKIVRTVERATTPLVELQKDA